MPQRSRPAQPSEFLGPAQFLRLSEPSRPGQLPPPGQFPPPVQFPSGPPPARPAGSRFAGKAWLLLAVPLGFTTWAAFLYIGIRARRARWLAWAAVYAATLAAYATLDSPAHPGDAAESLAAGLALLTWIGGGVHAFAISSDAVRRIRARTDPVVQAARARRELRAEGRRLLASDPGLAREIGVGRPDVPGSRDYGLVDVNHASAAALASLPGIAPELAGRISDARAQAGGFSSVEDLGLLLDLPPDLVDQLRDTTVFPRA